METSGACRFVDDDPFRLTKGEIRGVFILLFISRCRSLLAYSLRRAPNTKQLNFLKKRTASLDQQRVYMGHSLAMLLFLFLFGGVCFFCFFPYLSLVVITDTHSCNFSFVYRKSKMGIGFHLTSIFTSHTTPHIYLSVSQINSTVPYLDHLVSHNKHEFDSFSIR